MYDASDGSGPRDDSEGLAIGVPAWGFGGTDSVALGRPRSTPDSTVPDSPSVVEYKGRMAEIDRLGDEIAVLSAQIQAATYELLVRLREFDKRGGWGLHGAKSCAHWLAWRISLDPGAAREWVRVARALEHLPLLSEAMRKGEVSYSKMRALTRIATPETEAGLVELGRAGTASHIERIVRACRRYGPKEERDKERRLHDSRYVQISRDEDGMFILRARLDSVSGAVVARALDAAAEALYQQRQQDGTDDEASGGRSKARSVSEEGAHRAGSGSACRDNAGDELAPGQRRADALVLLAESALAGGFESGTAGDRYQVVVHVDAPVLADPAEQGVSCLSDGQHVSAETSRRLACDASTVVMTHAPNGSVLDVGRKTRTISPALRRALVERDTGCRFPGCGSPRCDAHHVKHWADGGETNLENTVLLCRFHHRLVHEEGFQLKRFPSGEIEIRRPDGRLIPEAPAPPRSPIDPFETLVKRLEDGAIVVDPYTGTPLWDGTPPDLGLAVEWFLTKTSPQPSLRPEGAGKLLPYVDDEADGATEPTADAPSELNARHQQGPDRLTADEDVEDEDLYPFEPSAQRIRELAAMVAEWRGPSVLTYEFVSSTGERLPFEDAIWHPEFHLDWNEDGLAEDDLSTQNCQSTMA